MANLLAWFKFPVGDGAFYAAFGFVFVFAGIAVMVLLFTLLGLVMKKINARKPKKKKVKAKKTKNGDVSEVAVSKVEDEAEEISPEIVAVITAAVAAVYEGENVKCDFVVQKIKRL